METTSSDKKSDIRYIIDNQHKQLQCLKESVQNHTIGLFEV